MYIFLIPLLVGFALNSISAYTTFFSKRWGDRYGRWACIILRDVLGIPLWAFGYALAAQAHSPLLFVSTLLLGIFAWALVLAGGLVIIVGMVSLRWRAVAPSIGDTLVATGLHAHIRHPLYSGMLLELVGLFLWFPSRAMSLACLLGVLWVFLQSRLEELDLLRRIPSYQDYLRRVPPFIPRLRG